MIDGDDVTFVALLFSGDRGWFSFVLFVIVVGVFWYIACENTKECEQETCPSGKHAELLEGRCVCVEAAK